METESNIREPTNRERDKWRGDGGSGEAAGREGSSLVGLARRQAGTATTPRRDGGGGRRRRRLPQEAVSETVTVRDGRIGGGAAGAGEWGEYT